jgi:hypothetical protein
MDLFEKIFENMNLWIIMLATGVVTYVIRLLTPDKIEGSKWFRVVLTLLPLVLGTAIAFIPGLRPFPESAVQSGAVGFIGGAFSSKIYDFVSSLVNDKIKLKLQGRKTEVGKEDEV